MDADEAARELWHAQERRYREVERYSGEPATANWVTNLCHPCPQYSLLVRRLPAPRPEPRIMAMWAQGRRLQQEAKDALVRQYGWSWVLDELRVVWREFNLVGRIDGVVSPPGGEESYVVEVKAVPSQVWMAVQSQGDLGGLSYWRHRSYGLQLLCYLWLVGEGMEQMRQPVVPGQGLLLLVDKGSGMLKAIPVSITAEGALDAVEALLQRAEAVERHLRDGSDLETPALGHEPWCRDCDFRPQCGPALRGKEPALLNSPRVLDLLARREELSEARSEYEKADAELKDILRSLDWDSGETGLVIAGDWTIERRVGRSGVRFLISRQAQPQDEEENKDDAR